jgi:cell division protein FtsQ
MWGKHNRRRPKKRQIPLPQVPAINWSRVVSAVAAVIVVTAAYVSTVWVMNRPIDAVVISGVFERVSADQLEEFLMPHIQTGFLSADLEGMQAELLNVSWVAGAHVRRRWPGTIEVSITEQQAAACWGASGLLNTQGELFVSEASHIPAELPRLNGPDGTQARVANLYFHIEEQLEQRGLAAVGLNLDSRGAWEFQLNNGITVRLGSRLVEQRLARFFMALDQVVAERAEQVDYIDMRYTNGFAIGWKESALSDRRLEQSGEGAPHV